MKILGYYEQETTNFFYWKWEENRTKKARLGNISPPNGDRLDTSATYEEEEYDHANLPSKL